MAAIFNSPSKYIQGPDELAKLGSYVEPLGAKALVIVTPSGKKRVGAKIEGGFAEAKAELLFEDFNGECSKGEVDRLVALARDNGCDIIVGVGGGKILDTAKAVAIMATNDGDWWDYIHGGTGGGKRMAKDGLPLVAIPTTAGTGTEADPFTVITNGEEKIGGGGEKCFPAVSIVDPDFMMTVPPHLTAYQGFDAFFHAAEGYLASTSTPMSDMFALQAIELIGRSLAAAVRDGSNAEARADVALANTLAGFVETLSSCTGEHAIEHALSAFHPDLPHGAGLIMISNAYWKRFAEVAGARMAAIARAMGKADATRPEDFLAALAEMQQACGVDTLRLADYGVREEDCGKIAENAVVTMGGLFRADPRRLESGEIEDIIRESI